MSWQARPRPVSVLADMALRQERVAQRLAELREQHALSQEKAAQKVGITHRQWQRWENGQSMPRPGNLGEVALAFGVPVTTFYEEDDAPAADESQLDRIEEKIDRLLAVAAPLNRLDARLRLLEAQRTTAEAEALARSEAATSAKARPRQRLPR